MENKVYKCVCNDILFSDWLAWKRAHGWSLEDAANMTHCGECCGMCKPYLPVVDATGITVLPVLIPEDLEDLKKPS